MVSKRFVVWISILKFRNSAALATDHVVYSAASTTDMQHNEIA